MRKLVLSFGVAAALLGFAGTASAQYYGNPYHHHHHGYAPGYYRPYYPAYVAPRPVVVAPAPVVVAPRPVVVAPAYPAYPYSGFNFGYYNPGFSFNLGVFR